MQSANLEVENDDLRQTHTITTETIKTLEAVTDSNRDTITDLRDQVKNTRIANQIASYAIGELRKAEESGEIRIAVDDGVKEIVTERLKQEVTAEQINQLIDVAEEKERNTYGVERIRAIRAEQDEILHGNGTYSALKRNVDNEIRSGIRADLLAARRAEVLSEIDGPEARAQRVVEEQLKLTESGIFDTAREGIIAASRSTWQTEAYDAAKADMDAEVEAEHEAYVAKVKDNYRQSDEGKIYVHNVMKAARRKWSDAGREEIAVELKDEATLKVLQELHDKTKTEVKSEKLHADYLQAFFKKVLIHGHFRRIV